MILYHKEQKDRITKLRGRIATRKTKVATEIKEKRTQKKKSNIKVIDDDKEL